MDKVDSIITGMVRCPPVKRVQTQNKKFKAMQPTETSNIVMFSAPTQMKPCSHGPCCVVRFDATMTINDSNIQ